jgi:hypothetical protein
MLQENSFFSSFKENNNTLSAKREKEAKIVRVKKTGTSSLSRCEADTCKRGHIFYAVCELLVNDSNTLPKYFPFT